MEETISLKEIFEVIKQRILLILAITLGAAVVAAIVSYFVLTPTYQSSSQFIVNQSTQEQEVPYNVNDIRANVEIINTYNVIIKSPAILEEVIRDRKSTRLNSSHVAISYAVFCLKKKNKSKKQ